MVGFPPAEDSLVTLANWQDPPNVRWAFRHMREIIPTQPIPARPHGHVPLAAATLDLAVVETELTRLDGSDATVGDVFADTWTDAVLVLHDGELVARALLRRLTPTTPHLLMSVSKSVVGCVAGILAGQGLLDPEAPVTKYVPEVADSGYDGATVRHLLDMRTGVPFRETYVEPDAEVRVMERSMGWRPLLEGDPLGMYDVPRPPSAPAGPHGGDFTYRSADTDMLGWVLRAGEPARGWPTSSRACSGSRSAPSTTPRSPATRSARPSTTAACPPSARDLARFGQLLLDDGVVDGDEVVPASWLADARNPPPTYAQAFASTDNEEVLPGGWYRNQFWFVPGPARRRAWCASASTARWSTSTGRPGRSASSSRRGPTPQNTRYLIDTLRAFGAIGTRLSGTSAPPHA